jgi:hypothetical protein
MRGMHQARPSASAAVAASCDTTGGHPPPAGSPKSAFWQAAVTACDSIINYNDFDNLIFVSEAFNDGMGTVRNAWPYGVAGTFATATGVNVTGLNPMIVSVTSDTTWIVNPPISQ